VAKGAFLSPSVDLLEVLQGVHCSGSIVTQLSKGFRDKKVSSYEKGGPKEDEHYEKTRDLLWHAVHLFQSGNRGCRNVRSLGADPGPSTFTSGKINAERC
jgi:hypothetical protein